MICAFQSHTTPRRRLVTGKGGSITYNRRSNISNLEVKVLGDRGICRRIWTIAQQLPAALLVNPRA